MNGFIQKTAVRWAGLAAVAASAIGCKALETRFSGDGSPNGGYVETVDENATCSSCGRGVLSHGACNSCGKKHKDFDYEQLHPDHCWPLQYNRHSMRRVNEPLGQQIVNGNTVDTTIWAHYFNNETGKEHELSDAGLARLRYLARRKPYVISELAMQTSYDSELDQKRVASAKAALKKASFEPVEWNITPTNRIPSGLYGPESPKIINKMIGPGGGPPVYETQIMRDFSGAGGGS